MTTSTIVYPATQRGNQVDDFHGTVVADPYRWLEDANSADTAAWVEAQNRVTMPFLAALPGRESMKTRLTELWNYEKRGLPFRRAKRYFFYLNTGLQNQSVLYTASRPNVKKARVLLDPNELSSDGTVSLSAISLSPDGNLMAYSVSYSGSDWQEWRIRNVATGKDLPDLIKWSKFSGASWTKDNNGFFYSRYAEPSKDGGHQDANYFHKLYYHKVGTSQSEDVLIYERPDQKEWSFSGSVTEDGRYLLISVWQGSKTGCSTRTSPLPGLRWLSFSPKQMHRTPSSTMSARCSGYKPTATLQRGEWCPSTSTSTRADLRN